MIEQVTIEQLIEAVGESKAKAYRKGDSIFLDSKSGVFCLSRSLPMLTFEIVISSGISQLSLDVLDKLIGKTIDHIERNTAARNLQVRLNKTTHPIFEKLGFFVAARGKTVFGVRKVSKEGVGNRGKWDA